MRVVGVELRRTSALLVAGVVAALVVGLLLWGPSTKNSTAWTRQWDALGAWVRYMLVFAWPLAIGAGALHGLRDARSGVVELFASMPRPRVQRVLRTFAAFAVALTSAYLLVLVVGGVRVVSATDHFTWGWVPVSLVGILALVGAAWVGIGVGRLVPSPLTPPLLAVAALTMVAVGEGPPGDGFRWTLLRPSVPAPRSVFDHVASSVTVGQAVWFAGVAVAGLLLAAVRRWWLGLVPLAVAGAVAVPLLPATPAAALTPDPVAAQSTCSDHLCLTRIHERERERLEGPAREALRLLSKLPSPPTTVREVAGPVRPAKRGPDPTDAVSVHLDDFTYFRRTPPTAEEITVHLISGAGTRTCGTGGSVREIAARTAATAWVTGRLEPLPAYRSWAGPEAEALSRRAWDALRAVPEAEQAARVQAAREAQAACSGDPLALLTGEAV